jgi:hypothetical protein
MQTHDSQIVTGISAYQMAMTYSDAIETFCSVKKISQDQFFQEAISQRLREENKAPFIRSATKMDDVLDPDIREKLKAKATRYSAIARVLINLVGQYPEGWCGSRDDLKKYLGVGHPALKGILFVLRQNQAISFTEYSKKIQIRLPGGEEKPIDYLEMFRLA